MLAKSITALATLAFAVTVAAEPQPYKPLMKMSVKQLFGVVRRQDNPGYQPEQAVCGEGNTCEEACGSGYRECASKDLEIHCFNFGGAQTCCPNKSGNSCDAGYYCTSDKEEETWCCPNGMDLVACAAAYSITGGLVPQTPPATSSEVSSSTYSPAPAPTSYSVPKNSSSYSAAPVESSTYSAVPSQNYPSQSYPATNITASATFNTPTPSAQAPTSTKVQMAGGSVAAPAGALFLVVVGFAALL